MDKNAYMQALRDHLSSLPEEEIKRALSFYEEAIQDRLEAGMQESDAIAELEKPKQAAQRIISELPAVSRFAAKLKSTQIPTATLIGLLILTILGSPLWVAILFAIAALFVAALVVLFSALLVIWVFTGLFICAIIPGTIVTYNAIITGGISAALLALGISLVISGAGLYFSHVTIALSRLIIQALSWLICKGASLFINPSAPVAWNHGIAHPLWKVVHLIAGSMIAVGIATALLAWTTVGFSTTRMNKQFRDISSATDGHVRIELFENTQGPTILFS
ncbi:DUF1700 domain-containing protein [Atopobium fossor]|uniref:DUF1700 domain-containing protein n=1 Tax=Atopobium fossor TaxID=39487 RepID=UPI000409EFCB|nr:DUF1700 domain-containing protein [Atopobium fossor]